MSGQTTWAVVIVIVLAAAVIGFLMGRASGGGSRQRTQELEAEVAEHKKAVDTYKREVEQHFDKTASLFVSMAGSYKELFEHLSSGYAKLSDGEEKDLFRQHVATMLLDGPKDEDGNVVDSEQSAAVSTDDKSESPAESSETSKAAAPADEPVTDNEASDAASEVGRSSVKEEPTKESPVEEKPAEPSEKVQAEAEQPMRLSPEEQKESEIRGVAPPHSAPMEEAAAERALENAGPAENKADDAQAPVDEEKKS